MYQVRSLFRNMGSLLVLQGTNYILPLITFPYLVRVLGADGFGTMAFAQAFAGYFVVVTEYGFNLTATRAVSVHRHDRRKVDEIFSTVLAVKLLLLAASAAVFVLSLVAFPRLRMHWEVEVAAFMTVVGYLLFPGWLFQGMERMGLITLVTGVARAMSTIALFVFVRSESDVVLATAIGSMGFLFAGVVGIAVAFLVFRPRLRIPSLRNIKTAFRDGWHVFVSQISVSLFGNTNVFILGLFAAPSIVGQFAVAEKIVRAVVGLSIPVTSAVYPTSSALFERSREVAIGFLQKVALGGGMVLFLASLALLLAAEPLVEFVTGEETMAIAILVKIMAILPLTIFIDNIYGTQILLNIGRQRRFMHVTLLAGFFSVAASLILVPIFGALGSAVVLTATELLILGLFIYSVSDAGIRLHAAFR